MRQEGADQDWGWEGPAAHLGGTSLGPLISGLTAPWDQLSQERRWAFVGAWDTGGPVLFLSWVGPPWANQILCF